MHLLNQVLYAVSGAAWCIAYILIIVRGIRDKAYGMPFIALAFNISWELCFSTFFYDGNPVHRVVNSAWFLLDLGILFTYFRYGLKDWPRAISPAFFYPYSFFVLGISFAITYVAVRELHDVYGAYTAYISNLVMALLYINLLNTRGGLSGQSAGIALAKLVGTGCYSIVFYIWHAKFLVLIGALIVFFDFIYLLMVFNEGRLVWPIRLKLRS
ncbi:hypothetical protein [Puia sp.]|uniref:transmembrane-type terpene cyclase n=1 Tax=Puia sp. TaxID=2045100 RepID=UPI002F3E5FED